MRLTLPIFALLLLPFAAGEVILTEIHPDPIADESLNEWVELHNNGSEPVDLSGWVFGDSADNDTIEGPLFGGEGAIIPSLGFAILTDETTRVYENYNITPGTIHLYVNDAALGNGLSNDGEMVFLFVNGTLISFANYSIGV